MRYPTTHKDQTRQRIIDVSSRLFKERGIDATGLATIMREADLTNGAFYAHFDSKEALVKESIVNELEQRLLNFWDVPESTADTISLIDAYLSPEHRGDFAGGCPSAALLDEIGRRPTVTKQAYNDGLLEFADSFQKRFPDLDEQQVRSLVFAVYGLLVGTLQLARATTDKRVSDQVLESGRVAARTLLNSAKS